MSGVRGMSALPTLPDGCPTCGAFPRDWSETPTALAKAAPDLLEELEQQADGCSLIISLLSGQKSAVSHSLVAMLRFQEANARAAIAKALGRTPNSKDVEA